MSAPEANPIRGVYERAAAKFNLRDASSFASGDLQPYRDEIEAMGRDTNSIHINFCRGLDWQFFGRYGSHWIPTLNTDGKMAVGDVVTTAHGEKVVWMGIMTMDIEKDKVE